MGGTAAAGGGERVAGVCSWRRRAACRGRFGPEGQARGSTGSARTRAPVRGASWVCALGACRRQEPPANLPPYLPADSPVRCGFLRAQRSWEDVPGSLGALGPWSAATGSGKGLRPRCSPAVVLPGRIRALPTPTVPPGALRAARAAAGEGRGPQSGASTPAGAPHPADSGRRELTTGLGPGGRGCFPEGPGGARAGPGAFSEAGAGGGVSTPTPARPTRGG